MNWFEDCFKRAVLLLEVVVSIEGLLYNNRFIRLIVRSFGVCFKSFRGLVD